MALRQGERALAQSLQANSRALVANQPTNQDLALARVLAVEGLEINEQVGSPDEKTASAGLLFSLAYEQPISYQAQTTLSEHTAGVWGVAWNGDGSRLASASSDNTVIIWEFPDFAQLNCQLAGRNLTLVEWEAFLPGVEYRCTCKQWPAGKGAPPGAPGCG